MKKAREGVAMWLLVVVFGVACAAMECACAHRTPQSERMAPTPAVLPAVLPAPTAIATEPPEAPAPSLPVKAESEWIACTPLVRVDREAHIVSFDATSVLDTGFLEQFVCLKETREHESLFVFEGKASDMHAALLLAGAVPGKPGRWKEVESNEGSFAVEGVAPEGTAIEITVKLPSGDEHPIAWFAREAPLAGDQNRTPPSQFVFGGSRFVTDKRTGSERYLADASGSLVGLVTFGDETIGAREVIPDQAAAAEPIWEAFTERMPKPGTRVTVLLQVRTSSEPIPIAPAPKAPAPKAPTPKAPTPKAPIPKAPIPSQNARGAESSGGAG